jgi:hypothetical protein
MCSLYNLFVHCNSTVMHMLVLEYLQLFKHVDAYDQDRRCLRASMGFFAGVCV